jgi:serine/threonine-protein kinase
VKLEAGQVLSGTLRLLRKVADGGMGCVWSAEHLVLGTTVAVKFMSGPCAGLPSARARFLREARMTANIDSPHVVDVLDCRHTDADEPYLVLELLHGETLEQRVRRHGVLSVAEVVEIVSQTCEALVATHAAGIVHRDLKPENVFLVAGPTTFVKLLDFGVAKPVRKEGCLAEDRLTAGTPSYMSPEHLFEPELTDARSDLFSLGAVAYFALTRRTPFDADSLEGLYFAIDGGAFARPSALRPELPPALDRWFEKALAHEPDRRFQDARAMAAALHDAARDLFADLPDTALDIAPVSRRETTLPELPLVRPRVSHARAAGALALGAAAAFLMWRATGDAAHHAQSALFRTDPLPVSAPAPALLAEVPAPGRELSASAAEAQP